MRFYESPLLLGLRNIDPVIAMGGPMSVNDEREYPWFKQKKEFIAQALRRALSRSFARLFLPERAECATTGSADASFTECAANRVEVIA